MLIDEY